MTRSACGPGGGGIMCLYIPPSGEKEDPPMRQGKYGLRTWMASDLPLLLYWLPRMVPEMKIGESEDPLFL